MAAVTGANTQSVQTAASKGFTKPQVTQQAVLAAYVGPAAMAAINSQEAVVGATVGQAKPIVTQQAVLAAYSTNIREDNTQRAWTFELDGHTMYVLDLGTTETYVYDLKTGQWSNFITQGYPIWNAQLGHMWEQQDAIVAADYQSPQIFRVDPQETLDEGFRPLVRRVSGLVDIRGRQTITADALYIQASAGAPQTDPATIKLFYSDDQGQTEEEFGTVVTENTDTVQEYAFLSLGLMQQPGRIFYIEDEGGPLRIAGVELITSED